MLADANANHCQQGEYTSVAELEDRRKALGGNYQPAQHGKAKIVDWKSKSCLHYADNGMTNNFLDVFLTIQDDGTLTPSDQRAVNEGLGQTHRAKLMGESSLQASSNKPDHRKSQPQQKFLKATAPPPALVTRGRVQKCSPFLTAPPKSFPSPTKKPKRNASPAKSFTRGSSHARTAIRTPPLADPQAWLASVPGDDKVASKSTQKPDTEAAPEAVKQPANEIAALEAIQQRSREVAAEPNEEPVSKDACVSVAFLMSLGINFTEEQLRALAEQPQMATDATEKAVSIPSPVEDPEPVRIVTKSMVKDQNSRTSKGEGDQVDTDAMKSSVANYQKSPNPVSAPNQTVSSVTNPFTASLQGERLTIKTSQSDVLRLHRENIIGSQVYRNRYSHVAGSLVEGFQRITLMESSSAPPPTTQVQSIANNSATTLPAQSTPTSTASAPKPIKFNIPSTKTQPRVSEPLYMASTPSKSKDPPAAPSAPALRPKFIPDAHPNPIDTHTPPPAALASRTNNNPPLATSNPFGPARRGRPSRPAGPSLPPHLMGKVANPDPGAAARAQYGGGK